MTNPTESQKPIDVVEQVNLALTLSTREGNDWSVEVTKCSDPVDPDVNIQDLEGIYSLCLGTPNDPKTFVIVDECGKMRRVKIFRKPIDGINVAKGVRGNIEETL